MTTKEAVAMINGRIDVLYSKCDTEKRNPDYYKSLKEMRAAQFIKRLLKYNFGEDDTLSDEDAQAVTQLFASKTTIAIEVHAGDSILDILDRYKEVKDIYGKIKKACEEKGLTIKGSEIVRA